MPRRFFDAASAAPLRSEAKAAMVHALELPTADPGRNYEEGRLVRDAIEHARAQVGAALEVAASRVTFLSSIPEAAATVLSSLRQRRDGPVVVSAVERDSFHEHAGALGAVITIPVDREGLLDLTALERALDLAPAAVCCQWANQETGIIQPIDEVLARCAATSVPVVVDASQAGRLEPTPSLGGAFVVVSSEGVGGPAGVVALTVPRGQVLRPLLRGGAQERGRRAGLEPTLLIVGFGAAAEANARERSAESARAAELMALVTSEATAVSGVRIIGPEDPSRRLPDVLSLEVDGVASEAIVVGLDRRGTAVHSGSACSSETFEPSPVLAAMGVDSEHSVRLSVSRDTGDDDVRAFGLAFRETVADLRRLAST